MLKNNFSYQDNYMYFAFNGIHSSSYNLMMQNNIDDLKIITNTNTSIDYISPKYQNGRYMMGVTNSHRPLPHKLIAYGLTRLEANQMAKWLAAGQYGPLIYDYAPDWQYNVVVNKLGDMSLYAIDNKHYIISFDIEFNTIEHTSAKNVMDAVIMLEASRLEEEQGSNKDMFSYYGVNNTANIPAIACYNATKDIADNSMYIQKSETQWTLPIFIHHLGNDLSLVNVRVNIQEASATAEENVELQATPSDTVSTYKLELASNKLDNNASIQFSSNSANALKTAYIIDYKSRNHLFFINDEMPETKVLRTEIKDLKTLYSNYSISFQSSGLIQSLGCDTDVSLETLQSLTATPYNWFIYCTDDEQQFNTPYYKLYGNAEPTVFPAIVTGTFLYDINFIKNDDSIDYLKLLTKIKGRHIYFGYYDILTITANPMVDITIAVTQHNDLPFGGEE